MKASKKIYLSIIILAVVGAIGYYAITFLIMGKDQGINENQPVMSAGMGMDMGGQNVLTQFDSTGEVGIYATLLPQKSENHRLVFEIVMNTDSDDLLHYDLTKLSALSFGTSDSNSGAFQWEPISMDPHHIVGYLTWTGTIQKNYQAINLELNHIDHISSLTLTWNQSESIDKIEAKKG